jgi:hypothetical protein
LLQQKNGFSVVGIDSSLGAEPASGICTLSFNTSLNGQAAELSDYGRAKPSSVTASTVAVPPVEETLTYYAFPSEHWRRIRTNNPLERILREIRRRTRVVGACERFWTLPSPTSEVAARAVSPASRFFPVEKSFRQQ